MANEFADIDKQLFSGEQKPPSAKEAAELQSAQQEQELIKQQADQQADSIISDSEFADIDRVLFKEGVDPITGNQRAFHANGVSPEKAINESPLTAGQRLKLSFSDEKGKMKFLQETFGAVQKTKGGQLAVLSGGKWHYVDPEGFGAVNPWKLTGDLLSGDVGVQEYLEGMAVSSAEEIGDIADIAKEIGLGAASAAAAAATGGASLLAQAGVMGAAGAGVSLASTSMGKGMGTYSGTIEDQLQEAGIEGLFNLAGGYVVPKAFIGMAKGAKHLKGAVISSGDDLAKAIDKNRVGHFMLKQVDNLSQKAANWTADAKDLGKQALMASPKISSEAADALLDDTATVKAILNRAVKSPTGSVRPDTEASAIVTRDIRENTVKFVSNVRQGLSNMYQKHMDKVKEALPPDFSMRANGAAKTLTDTFEDLGITKDGILLSGKKLQPLADNPELANNNLIRELSANPKARPIIDRLIKRLRADVVNTKSLNFDDAIKVDKRVRGAFTQAMKEADDPTLSVLRKEFKSDLTALKDTYIKNFDSLFERSALEATNRQAAKSPTNTTIGNLLRNSRGEGVTTAQDPVKLYRELKSAYNEASKEAAIFTTLHDKVLKGKLDDKVNDAVMSVSRKITGHAADNMVSDKALQIAQRLSKYNPAIDRNLQLIRAGDAAGVFIPKGRFGQFLQFGPALALSSAVGSGVMTGDLGVATGVGAGIATMAAVTSPRMGFKALLASKGAKQAFLGSLRRVRSLAGSIPQNKLQELMSNPQASNLLKQSLIRPVASQVNTELQLQQMMQQQAQGGAQ